MGVATGETEYERYRATRFFAALDGLRCFCILMVLWHHAPAQRTFDDPFQFMSRGFTGVDFFFVLSGFLITTLLVREEAEKGRFSLRGFYRRRILRIVPVYFLVVTLSSIWFVGVRGYDLGGLIPYYYAFLSNFLIEDIPLLAPTWSLSIEEQYYLMWPLLLLLLPMRFRVRAGVVLAILVYAFLVTNKILERPFFGATEHAAFHLPIGVYAPILIGSLLALALHRPAGFAVLWRLVGWRGAPLFYFVLLLLLWEFLPEGLSGWPNFLMHPTMALVIASLVIRPDHVAVPLLTWRPIARIGAISYGLYLWHLVGRHIGVETVRALDIRGDAGAWLASGILVVTAILIAEASFRLFEVHFLRLKTPRAQRPRPVTAPESGSSSNQAG